MKIGLPIWGQRLSPVLDFAHRLLIVEVKDGVIVQRRHHSMNPRLPIISQATELAHLNINLLICGSISLDLANLIRSFGIRIIPFVTGEIEEILQAYLDDTLANPHFRMPGVKPQNKKLRPKDAASGKKRSADQQDERKI